MKNKTRESTNLPRRTAIKNGIIASAAAAVSTLSSPDASHAQGSRRGPKNMHVSLAAYSHREALKDGRLDLFKFIDWCARLNIAGVELTSYYFKEGFDSKYLHDLRHRAFDQGLTVSGTAVRNNFCMPDGPEKRKEVDQMKKWIDHAAELFAPHIRIFAGNLKDGTDKKTGIQQVADGVRECLDHAGDRGIVLGLENHGGITARVADHLAICDAVGEHPWFGINLDTGNYKTNPYEELAMAAPRAVNVQVKLEVFKKPEGPKEFADLERLREILVKAKYKGWVALEYEVDGDPFIEIPQYLKTMKELFQS